MKETKLKVNSKIDDLTKEEIELIEDAINT